MHVQLQAPHCPNCAAPVVVEEGRERVVCAYCDSVLLLEVTRPPSSGGPDPERGSAALWVRSAAGGSTQPEGPGTPGAAQEPGRSSPVSPAAQLVQHVAPRFEMCLLQQSGAGAEEEIFRWIELPEERFAVVALRPTDADGSWIEWSLDRAYAVLVESLEDDADPGLAANLALEEIFEGSAATRPPDLRLACAIAVFDPERHRVRSFSAGYDDVFWWVSTEEGRCIQATRSESALERRDLGRASDLFANGPQRELAASDLFVVLSAATRGFGNQRSGAVRGLLQVLNDGLGEHPLRLVTLAKNRYWEDRGERYPEVDGRPFGWLAVRAVLPELDDAAALTASLESAELASFDLALARSPGDSFERLPLDPDVHGPREALLWMLPAEPHAQLPEGSFEVLLAAAEEILGRAGHGDNENPQAVGERVLASLPADCLERVRFRVLHLAHEHNAVRWFQHGLHGPLCLEARGLRGDFGRSVVRGAYAAYPRDGARLWFPGPLDYPGDPHIAADLATLWPGGKASRLYEALRLHWRTRKTGRALTRILQGVRSDVPGGDLGGSLLLSSRH